MGGTGSEAVEAELVRQLKDLDRHDLTRESLEEFGALILVEDETQACKLTDEFAEHLHIQTQKPQGNDR